LSFFFAAIFLKQENKRLGLPEVPAQDFVNCIAKLVQIDKRFIPVGKGFALYLRPAMIATTDAVGLKPPKKAKFFCICSPGSF